MDIRRRSAHPALRRFVASFSERRADLRETVRTEALPARPDQFVEIYLAERYGVLWNGRPPEQAPETTVVGPQSRPGLRLHMSGRLDVFTVRFQPTGFHDLFGVPMPELVDAGAPITHVVGRGGRSLAEAVAGATAFEARVEAAERWLATQAERAKLADGLAAASRLLVRSGGTARIGALAERSGLSARQFERRFVHAVGVTPKFYARTVRLARAFDLKARRPELGWAEIALRAGYVDQAHLSRDASALAGAPPAQFLGSGRVT